MSATQSHFGCSLILFASLAGSSTLGCGVLERADAGVGQDSLSQGSSGEGDAPDNLGGAGSLPTIGSGTGGSTNGGLFEGCPVMPCPGESQTGTGGTAAGTGGTTSAPVSTGLITNGDFSSGAANWKGENGTLNVTSGAGCVTATGDDPAILGWDKVVLDPGMYTFSFDVVGSGDLVAKVGGTTDPWTVYAEQMLPTATAGKQTVMFSMEASAEVGLAFIFNSGTACIDNASLVKN